MSDLVVQELDRTAELRVPRRIAEAEAGAFVFDHGNVGRDSDQVDVAVVRREVARVRDLDGRAVGQPIRGSLHFWRP